jgi:hypothetical protein
LDLSISFLFRGAVKWAILLDKASMVRPRIQKKDQQEQRMIIRQTLGLLGIGKKVFERLIEPVHKLPFQGSTVVPYDKASMVRPRIQKEDQQEQRQTSGLLCIGKKSV